MSGPSSPALSRLLDVVRNLRDEKEGCAWNRKQTLTSFAPFVLEEAYEVVVAIEGCNTEDLKEELGDLLYQVVFLCQIASEGGLGFGLDAVADRVAEKMKRRHPNVFGDVTYNSFEEQGQAWDEIKTAERRGKVTPAVPLNYPSLSRAVGLRKKRAGAAGDDLRSSMRASLVELEQMSIADERQSLRTEGAIGELLMQIAHLAADFGIDPEKALRLANVRWERNVGE